MARTLDEILIAQLGQLTYKCAQLGCEVEQLRDEVARLKAPAPPEPTP